MLNRDRKRKKSTFTLSSVTNEFINELSDQRGINKSKLVDEALAFYYENINCPPIPVSIVEVINNDLPIKDEEVLSVQYDDETKECLPNNSKQPHWLDEIEFDQSVPTNVTEYTIQQQENEMRFKDFSDLMDQDKKYEIKGPKLVLKEEYVQVEGVKTGGQLQSMSELISKAKEEGLVFFLGH